MIGEAPLVYLAVAVVVLGVNLLPAFGPPTWAVLVLFRLQTGAAAVPLVVIGALAAASGRFLLAHGARHIGDRLPPRRRIALADARSALERRRRMAVLGLVLFVVSPLPSAQLFLAAGLLGVPLVPATAAFFAGRLVSYAGYVAAAGLAERSLGEVLTDTIRSPMAVAVQLTLLVVVAVLPFVPWRRSNPTTAVTIDPGGSGRGRG